MILVDFYVLPGDRILGFRFQGHAGWADKGMDIVCAAVSSAAYLTANTITEVLELAPETLRAEEGEMLLRLRTEDAPACRALLDGLSLHMEGLEKQYPAHMRVAYVEA